MTKTNLNVLVAYFFWIIGTMIGWSAGILNLESNAETYMDIIFLLPVYFANGLMIGLLVGAGQALVLRKFTDSISPWIWSTILGYGLAFPVGLIISVLIPSIVWILQGEYLLPFVEPSTAAIFLNMDDLFWGGFLIGFIQWRALKKIIPNPNRNKGILWVLATWFVFGMSIFIRALTYGNFLDKFQMGIMGIVMGITTGLVLFVLLQNSPRRPITTQMAGETTG